MERLAGIDSLVVTQKKEWGEILTPIETRNKYTISSPSGEPLFAASEEGGSVLVRMFLKAMRPFTMMLYTYDRQSFIKLKRPFRFFFSEIEVLSADGEGLGRVEREFALLSRKYRVSAADGMTSFDIHGPLFHPWTFNIMHEGRSVGAITKKWSGILKEAFTDADNFSIQFPPRATKEERAVLLGALFLIDFCHFENRGN